MSFSWINKNLIWIHSGRILNMRFRIIGIWNAIPIGIECLNFRIRIHVEWKLKRTVFRLIPNHVHEIRGKVWGKILAFKKSLKISLRKLHFTGWAIQEAVQHMNSIRGLHVHVTWSLQGLEEYIQSYISEYEDS